ncbi:MAG: hypothetical protein CBB60_009725 [Armatimonadetes bacterium Cent15-Ar3]|nr:MAG: hypothetical protein CBB60_009725 [Armatimonadetes bacterium Cent15-Ar3]
MISALLSAICLAPVPSLPLKVDGEGYLRFTRGSNVLYSRSEVVIASPKGLVASDGSILSPKMFAPAGTTSLTCSLDGEVMAQVGGTKQRVGRIVLAVFNDNPSFINFGSMLSTLSKPTLTNPGEGASGVIRLEKVAATTTSQPTRVQTPKPKTTGVAGNSFTSAAAAEVVVRAESLVESEVITLDSIADISGDPALVKMLKNIDLGRTPYFGTARNLSTAAIRANIAAAQIDIRTVRISVPTGARVSRKSQSITINLITQTVSDAFKKKFEFDADLELKTRQFDVPVPVGEASVEASNLQIRDGQLTATIDILVNRKLVTTLNLTYGTGNIPSVKLGDEVKLKMISSAAVVVIKARAQGQAFLGQKVTVKTETGSIQTGILLVNNTVEVRL